MQLVYLGVQVPNVTTSVALLQVSIDAYLKIVIP